MCLGMHRVEETQAVVDPMEILLDLLLDRSAQEDQR